MACNDVGVITAGNVQIHQGAMSQARQTTRVLSRLIRPHHQGRRLPGATGSLFAFNQALAGRGEQEPRRWLSQEASLFRPGTQNARNASCCCRGANGKH